MKNSIKKQVTEIAKEQGLNSVYAFLRSKGIKFEKEVFWFGLDANKKDQAEKAKFIAEKTPANEINLHYYSIGIKSRKTGYTYNRIRGIKLKLQ